MTDTYYKASDQVLTLHRSMKQHGDSGMRYYTYLFDFEFRTVTVDTHYSDSTAGTAILPFSAVDPEVLARMRKKLADMGGKPDPLPGETETKPALQKPRNAQKGLNP